MAEIQHQRIKGLYGEFRAMAKAIPNADKGRHSVVQEEVGQQYNAAVDELSQVSSTDYSRYKLGDTYGAGRYDAASTRIRISSLAGRLEKEFGFGGETHASMPLVLTVNQNQSVNLNIIPIQQLIDGASDADLRNQLESLRQAVEQEKDPRSTQGILNAIMNKSWEVFMKVLPYVLEHMGNQSSH